MVLHAAHPLRDRRSMALSALQRTTFLVALAGCSTAAAPFLDSGTGNEPPRPDAPPVDMPPPIDMPPIDMPPPIDAPPGIYSHTVTIDGVDDFTAVEQFATTSNGFAARVTWDATNIYIAYTGPDIAPTTSDAKQKWLFAYVDTDPGAATGATESQTYNTQKAKFPAGFGAEFYARWRCDATFHTLEKHAGGASWSTTGAVPPASQVGPYLEFAIPRVAIESTGTSIGLVTWMINEKPGVEGTFAGLFQGNFTNGYGAAMQLTKYLRIDLTSPNPPNDPGNVGP
jgi:hypothetical protein